MVEHGILLVDSLAIPARSLNSGASALALPQVGGRAQAEFDFLEAVSAGWPDETSGKQRFRPSPCPWTSYGGQSVSPNASGRDRGGGKRRRQGLRAGRPTRSSRQPPWPTDAVPRRRHRSG